MIYVDRQGDKRGTILCGKFLFISTREGARKIIIGSKVKVFQSEFFLDIWFPLRLITEIEKSDF